MKTKFLFASLVIIMTTMASCKKDYTCSCKKVYTGNSSSVSVDDGKYLFHETKGTATDKCNAEQKTDSDIGGDYSRVCTVD